MKLLLCNQCGDVFRLVHTERFCECGACSGHYLLNGRDAVVNGEGVSLAIGNGSLQMAVANLRKMGPHGKTRDTFVHDDRYRVLCWVRPHEGAGNPHTVVEKEVAA